MINLKGYTPIPIPIPSSSGTTENIKLTSEYGLSILGICILSIMAFITIGLIVGCVIWHLYNESDWEGGVLYTIAIVCAFLFIYFLIIIMPLLLTNNMGNKCIDSRYLAYMRNEINKSLEIKLPININDWKTINIDLIPQEWHNDWLKLIELLNKGVPIK